jgi:hypothetical protein
MKGKIYVDNRINLVYNRINLIYKLELMKKAMIGKKYSACLLCRKPAADASRRGAAGEYIPGAAHRTMANPLFRHINMILRSYIL